MYSRMFILVFVGGVPCPYISLHRLHTFIPFVSFMYVMVATILV